MGSEAVPAWTKGERGARWLALAGPSAAVVAHRAVSLVVSNPGTRIDVVQVVLLAVVTLGVLVALGRALVAAGLDPDRTGFGLAVAFYFSRSPVWVLLVVGAGQLWLVRLFVVVVPIILGVAAYRAYIPFVRPVLMMFFAVSAVLQVGTAVVDRPAEAGVEVGAPGFAAPTRTGDLVILVLDEYARGDTLQAEHGHDNGPFEAGLDELGIGVVPGAVANYTRSAASISSLLSGSYPVLPGRSYTEADRRRLTSIIGGDGPLVAWLRAQGYRYTHIEGPWTDARCGSGVDVCHSTGWFDETTITWFQANPYAGMVSMTYGHPFPRRAAPTLAQLRQTVAEASTNGEPDLVFAHVVSPHFPYSLSARCHHRVVGQGDEPYADQIECVNELVLAALADITEATDELVVVVTGDHGKGDLGRVVGPAEGWTDEEVRSRLQVFSALKTLPDCPRPGDDATLVVIIDHAVACAIGVEPRGLDERAYIIEDFPIEAGGIVEVDLDVIRASP